MDYRKYLQDVLEQNQAILMDTSTLMKTERLRKFLEEVKEYMEPGERKIIILDPVWKELHCLTESRNEFKKEAAEHALRLMEEYKTLFEYQSQKEWEEYTSFADAAILAELVKYKAYRYQLLISNDRRMSEDAVRMNRLESVDGKQVTACYLDMDGKLRKSDVMCEEYSENVPAEGPGEEAWKLLRATGTVLLGMAAVLLFKKIRRMLE